MIRYRLKTFATSFATHPRPVEPHPSRMSPTDGMTNGALVWSMHPVPYYVLGRACTPLEDNETSSSRRLQVVRV